MASSIMVESRDLGETLVDEEEALVTYKRLTGKMGLNEKIATLLVSNMRCTTLKDHENPQRHGGGDKIIPAITDLSIPSVVSSRVKELIKAIREAAKVSLDLKQKGTVGDVVVPLPSGKLKRLETLLFNRYKLRFSADKTQEEQW